ncbi:MAG: hypothetical protein WCH39_16715 [Schlesneria sp.]
MSKRVEKKTAKRTRRSFTDEFKREAVALLLDGHSASSVADWLGDFESSVPVEAGTT